MKKILIGLVAILFLCGIIAVVGSLSSKSEPKVEPGTVASQKAEVIPVAETKSTQAPQATVAKESVTPKPTNTPAPKPTNTPTPARVGLSKNSPAPVGEPIIASNGIGVAVGETMVKDATKLLKSYNQFNSDPKPGYKHILVSVGVMNLNKGEGVVKVKASSFAVVGSSGRIINPTFAVLKSELDAELFEGGKAVGEIAFEIPEDEKNLILIYDSALFGGQRYFLALPE